MLLFYIVASTFSSLTIAFILTISQIFYSPSFMAHETFLNNNLTIYNFFVQCVNNFFTGFCFVVCHEPRRRYALLMIVSTSCPNCTKPFVVRNQFATLYSFRANKILKLQAMIRKKFSYRIHAPPMQQKSNIWCLFQNILTI